MMIRRTVVFSGIVQGVGFRYGALTQSADFEVTGTVENLVDGTVRMVAEGTPKEIDRFVGRVLATTRGRVTNVEQYDEVPEGCFRSFTIQRR